MLEIPGFGSVMYDFFFFLFVFIYYLTELLQKTCDEKNSRVECIDDNGEEDGNDLDGGVFISGLGGCERLLTIEPAKKTDGVLSAPLVRH